MFSFDRNTPHHRTEGNVQLLMYERLRLVTGWDHRCIKKRTRNPTQRSFNLMRNLSESKGPHFAVFSGFVLLEYLMFLDYCCKVVLIVSTLYTVWLFNLQYFIIFYKIIIMFVAWLSCGNQKGGS